MFIKQLMIGKCNLIYEFAKNKVSSMSHQFKWVQGSIDNKMKSNFLLALSPFEGGFFYFVQNTPMNIDK